MHAWRGHSFGSPEILVWEEVDDPPLAEGEVRIEVAASAINFPDVLFTAGTHQVRPTPPFIPGFEVAGVVVESREPSLPPGARVAATLPGSGGYATRVIAGPRTTYALPDGMPFEDGAALTITYQTGHLALHRRAGLQPGDTVLVHAGAGGVGSAAIQLAKAAGATVIATAGGHEKVAICRALGADVAIDYRSEDFVAAVKDLTSGRGADIVFDPVGGDAFDRSTKCIAFEGRILVIGFASGHFPAARANHLLVKNYAVIGFYWGTYSRAEPALTRRVQDELYALYGRGAIKPLISSARPMAEARAAMSAVASRATTGKVVLTNTR
ncbi:NADPH:quinone oxidoreductase [Sorangium cellulosum]|uniref:NADPH:quinone oxidoreductase n=1 Tax=Sorangium cellulosum TaxID=56 RepID=A0A2L0FAG3_SORCE|nr:NADPH:quinone oxidoreductase family protein [Sorangium cellulosum]AUX48588.1 NADPH:quinone oxidoreductase [Sorangium cellulosum]